MNQIRWFLLNNFPRILSMIIFKIPTIGSRFKLNYFSDFEENSCDLLLQKSATYEVNLTNVILIESTLSLWNPPDYTTVTSVENVYVNQKKEVIYLVEEGVLVTMNGISTRSFLYPSEIKTFNPHYIFTKIFALKNRKSIEKGLFILDRYSNYSYYHFVIEFLPRYFLYLKSDIANLNLPIFLPYNSPSFVRQSILLVNPKQIIFSLKENEFLKVKELYSIDQTQSSSHINPLILSEMKRSFFAHFNVIKNDAEYDGIYVSRSTNGRRLINEDELADVFKEFRIKKVNFEGLSVLEQIQIMSTAKILIGTHGANLTNGIYMPANSKVIEITTADKIKNPDNRYCYYSLFGSLNMKYCPIIGESTEWDNFNADVYINKEFVREALQENN